MSKQNYDTEQNYGIAADGKKLPKARIAHYNFILSKKGKEEKAKGSNDQPAKVPTLAELVKAASKKEKVGILTALEGLSEDDVKKTLKLKAPEIEALLLAHEDVLEVKETAGDYNIHISDKFEGKKDAETKSEESPAEEAKTFADLEDIAKLKFDEAIHKFVEEEKIEGANAETEDKTLRLFAQSLSVEEFDSKEIEALRLEVALLLSK